VTGRYDEHDHEHYERPRRRTRPRTKERPTYDDAVDGVVTTVDRGRFTLLVGGPMVNPVEWWDPHWMTDRVDRKLREAR